MTTRDIAIGAEPVDAFEATVEVLERAVTEGAFKEVLNESPRRYAIGWKTVLTGARYDFRFERGIGGTTQAEAILEFSGFMGPLLTLFRGAGNGSHLEQILGDIKDLAESEEFYEDQEEETDEDEDDGDEDDEVDESDW